jgi:hypothetical protein
LGKKGQFVATLNVGVDGERDQGAIFFCRAHIIPALVVNENATAWTLPDLGKIAYTL